MEKRKLSEMQEIQQKKPINWNNIFMGFLIFFFSFMAGMFTIANNVEPIEGNTIIINNYNNQSEWDVYECEQQCLDWFKVFVGDSSQLSCGDMWYTDCFKHCYETQNKLVAFNEISPEKET